MGAVGEDADLAARVASRLDPDLAQRDCKQADRHLFTGRGNDVHFARIGIR